MLFRPLLPIVLLVVLAGCATAPPATAPAASPDLRWEFSVAEQDAVPVTAVALVVDGEAIPVGEANVAAEIDREEWERYRIPAEALTAAGGAYGGGGTYYYAVREGASLVIYRGYDDAETPPEEALQYEAVRTVAIPRR